MRSQQFLVAALLVLNVLLNGCGKLQELRDENENKKLISARLASTSICLDQLNSVCEAELISIRPLSFFFYIKWSELPASFIVRNEKQEILDTLVCDINGLCDSYADEILLAPTTTQDIIKLQVKYRSNQQVFKASAISLEAKVL